MDLNDLCFNAGVYGVNLDLWRDMDIHREVLYWMDQVRGRCGLGIGGIGMDWRDWNGLELGIGMDWWNWNGLEGLEWKGVRDWIEMEGGGGKKRGMGGGGGGGGRRGGWVGVGGGGGEEEGDGWGWGGGEGGEVEKGKRLIEGHIKL